jgi:hypothetical protein
MNGTRTHIKPANRMDRMRSIERDVVVLLAESDVLVTVEPYEAKGTNAQNRYFHDLCDHAALHWNAMHRDCPTTPAAVKWDMKTSFGLIETYYCPASGTRVAHPASWRRYNKQQRSDLIEATRAWMASENIPDLPDLAAEPYDYPEARRA